MVFQNYALYPHMTVRENMGFALQASRSVDRSRDPTAASARRRGILGLEPLSRAHARASSRAASASASPWAAPSCAIPQVFLFDEPLSNLDAKLRVQMRTEIKRAARARSGTTIDLRHARPDRGHDPGRPASWSCSDGRIEQIGTPLETSTTGRPIAFVAGFIGSPAMNLVPGRVAAQLEGAPPHADRRRPGAAAAACRAPSTARAWSTARGLSTSRWWATATKAAAEVRVVEPTALDTQVALRVAGHEVVAQLRERIAARPGELLRLQPQAALAHVFDAGSGLRLN